MEAVNTNFKVIGLTQLKTKPESTAAEADTLTTRPSKLLKSLTDPMAYWMWVTVSL